MRPAIFLDRDGVINAAVLREGCPHPPHGPAELQVLPGVEEACALLRRQGFLLICVTNQPDVARGTRTREEVEALNARLREALSLHDIRVCYHDDPDVCACRKPRPGLLLEAARDWKVDLPRSFLVGDRFKDIEAGRRAGCTTILLGDGYGEGGAEPHLRVRSLAEATTWILYTASAAYEVPAAPSLRELSVKVFADGADLQQMLALAADPLIAGFTTNPTLMRQAGVDDYRDFGREVAAAIPDRPLSLEVFADEFEEMERQAFEIASWGPSVYVKIPVTNTRGESASSLISRLAREGIRLNVTALLTPAQVHEVSECLADGPSAFVSVFAGRIADSGRDPLPLMASARSILEPYPNLELIWASPRELLNIFQADAIGCHIITVTHDLLGKLRMVGKDLTEYSLDTVRMFHEDAKAAGYRL